jgi:hypothetical protein
MAATPITIFTPVSLFLKGAGVKIFDMTSETYQRLLPRPRSWLLPSLPDLPRSLPDSLLFDESRPEDDFSVEVLPLRLSLSLLRFCPPCFLSFPAITLIFYGDRKKYCLQQVFQFFQNVENQFAF